MKLTEELIDESRGAAAPPGSVVIEDDGFILLEDDGLFEIMANCAIIVLLTLIALRISGWVITGIVSTINA